MTEVTVETPEEEPSSDDTVVVAPTVIVPDSDSGGDTERDMALGAAQAKIEELERRLAETEQTADTAEVTADLALAVAVAEPEPEPVAEVVEIEPDEEPVKEPWTHRKLFG